MDVEQITEKNVEVPRIEHVERYGNVPVTKAVEVPQIRTVQRTVEASQIQYVERVADLPLQWTAEVPPIQRVTKCQGAVVIETVGGQKMVVDRRGRWLTSQ